MTKILTVRLWDHEWEVRGELHKAERMTREHPGAPEYFELESVTLLHQIAEDLGGKPGEMRTIRIDLTKMVEEQDLFDAFDQAVTEALYPPDEGPEEDGLPDLDLEPEDEN